MLTQTISTISDFLNLCDEIEDFSQSNGKLNWIGVSPFEPIFVKRPLFQRSGE